MDLIFTLLIWSMKVKVALTDWLKPDFQFLGLTGFPDQGPARTFVAPTAELMRNWRGNIRQCVLNKEKSKLVY